MRLPCTTPRTISLSVSDDGRHFHPVRSLSQKTHPEDSPVLTFEPLEPSPAAVHAFVLDVGFRARYVRLDFATKKLLICDEIAVLTAAGPVETLPPAPEGEREYFDNVFDRREQYAQLIAPGNLLADRELVYAPKPNYRLTTNEDDPFDLTDGKLGQRTDERIWFEKGAVGWQHSPLVTVFADLGSVQPIDSVVVRALGGGEQGSLLFPDEIRVLLSEDGEDYFRVSARHKRGLDDLSDEAWDLPEENLAWVHNFRLPVGRKARHLAIQLAHQKQFICLDEIAVVKGPENLAAFQPSPDKRIVIVTSGVAFSSHHAVHPICANMPLRTKIALLDARSADEYNSACNLILDLPDTVRFVTEGYEPEEVTHDNRTFARHTIPCNRGKHDDFYLQSLLPPGKTDVLYMYGESGNGLENERKIPWQSIGIPPARRCKRLHVSLAWMGLGSWYDKWPDGIQALRHLGFNAVGCFPRYWREDDLPHRQRALQAARDAGMSLIVNESPAGALSRDRGQPETKSILKDSPSDHVCPSYRGQYYQKEHRSFGQHAVWCEPDFVFYDIEAYWNGAQEAPRCERCTKRFAEGEFADWDDFRAAMGKEIHEDMKRVTESALADAGIERKITYGSYRTEPINKLNDGLFRWGNLYPDLLQLAMPSLYVVGNQTAVANSISRNRAVLETNDIIPWLTTGTYGQFEPVRTRDMILEAFANGARGITYYAYGDFDPLHFKYHAEAIDLVAPIEDLFVDGAPIEGVKCDNDKMKVCGMRVGNEMAVLVSSYAGLTADTRVRVTVPVAVRSPVWDLHIRKRVAEIGPGGSFELRLGGIGAHLFYVGSRYVDAVSK